MKKKFLEKKREFKCDRILKGVVRRKKNISKFFIFNRAYEDI